MNYSINLKRGESIIYIVLWMVILLMPVFFSNTNTGMDWSRVRLEWFRFLPFFIVFLVHNYLLFPRFFSTNKSLFYYALTLVLVLLAGLFADYMGIMLGLRPEEAFHPFPKGPMGFEPPRGQPPLDLPPAFQGPKDWNKTFIDNTLVSFLVVGFNAAIKLTVKWQAEEQKNKELEKEKLKTELAFLKNQVSPHFFMNTLNNIHALIDINAETAKESVIKLSKLMRYLLYDSEAGKTTLTKEVEFIKSYIDLMKLRFTSQVEVNLSFPPVLPNIVIPPMLFTSLLENAFKHGISYQKKSFVELIVKTDQKSLLFQIRNSKKDNNTGLNEPGGIGLENLKKRLNLIYQDRYSLEQKEDKDTFEINIKLPIHG